MLRVPTQRNYQKLVRGVRSGHQVCGDTNPGCRFVQTQAMRLRSYYLTKIKAAHL